MRKGLIFIISGPAGSGKGTVVNIIRSKTKSVGVSVSATTRDPRPGETDGVSYHFITRERFLEMIENGEMVEHSEVYDDLKEHFLEYMARKWGLVIHRPMFLEDENGEEFYEDYPYDCIEFEDEDNPIYK